MVTPQKTHFTEWAVSLFILGESATYLPRVTVIGSNEVQSLEDSVAVLSHGQPVLASCAVGTHCCRKGPCSVNTGGSSLQAQALRLDHLPWISPAPFFLKLSPKVWVPVFISAVKSSSPSGDFPDGPVAKTTLSMQGGLGLSPGLETRSHMLQLKIPCATTKTWHS